MAGMEKEAFDIAKLHDQMEFYVEIFKDQLTPEIYNEITIYFEQQKKYIILSNKDSIWLDCTQ
jgi:hypothetical protein